MNKSIPATDPAMKSHHDIGIFFNIIFFIYKNVQPNKKYINMEYLS
jgi:hypothetical protein